MQSPDRKFFHVAQSSRRNAGLREQDVAVRQGPHLPLYLRPARRQARARVADRSSLRLEAQAWPGEISERPVGHCWRDHGHDLLRGGRPRAEEGVHRHWYGCQQGCSAHGCLRR